MTTYLFKEGKLVGKLDDKKAYSLGRDGTFKKTSRLKAVTDSASLNASIYAQKSLNDLRNCPFKQSRLAYAYVRGRAYCARACVYACMRGGVYRARGHALVMFASKTDLAVSTQKYPFELPKYPFGFSAEKPIAEFKKGILIFTSLGRVKKKYSFGRFEKKIGISEFSQIRSEHF